MFGPKKELIAMHQSPLKEKDIEQLSEDKRELLNELQNLFTYYASKFDRHSYHELSQKAFNEIIGKLMKKDKSSPQKSPQKVPEEKRQERQIEKSMQLLYYSRNGAKEGVTFQQFLDLIPQMANIMYRSLDKGERMQLLMSDLRFLYKKEVLTQLQGKLVNINFIFRQETMNYVYRLVSEFQKIYKAYFPHEFNKNIKKSVFKNESLRSFFTFLKEFEIFPKLVTAGQTYFIYHEALKSPNSDCLQEPKEDEQQLESQNTEKPICFSLGKFVSCLIVISKNCFAKLRQIQQTESIDENQKQAFKTLLEEIEMNKAYKNARHLRQTNQTFSFILLDEYPKELQAAKSRRTVTAGGTDRQRQMQKKGSQFLRLLNNLDV